MSFYLIFFILNVPFQYDLPYFNKHIYAKKKSVWENAVKVTKYQLLDSFLKN